MYLRKIEIKNYRLWKVATIELEQGSTVIVGKNNTGKTYVNYLIYGFVRNLLERLDMDIRFDGIHDSGDNCIEIDVGVLYEQLHKEKENIENSFREELPRIFKINRETYGRSVYVTLSETPAGSTDISAKLNNLVEADDVTKYDDAIDVIEKKATAIKAKRGKNDLVSNLQDRIDSDRNYLDDIKSKIKQKWVKY